MKCGIVFDDRLHIFADDAREPEHQHNMRYLLLLKIQAQNNIDMLTIMLYFQI